MVRCANMSIPSFAFFELKTGVCLDSWRNGADLMLHIEYKNLIFVIQ
ncbi:hypothetical protein HMPREF0645_0497 [Hallella bergensis DSM 17361]|uniref:Uncharacterized protein n=1 Tax=Hallella bergensis DSM 17361 TaxID=585502 RepID=D1PU62_9BACT|nr:hypothetical protein HMPREF0645_0497 [Hallella bergensis DSM 17361]